MYQVLLVDDEPLILSGIKFLIDWQQQDCQIVDTARNGQQALEKIRQLQPDIVICDISMPVLTGTELLSLTAKESPATVFIMLTNHPDFDLARESLRFAAVDYLLKSQLSAETLEKSLARAKAERDKRSLLAKARMADSYRAENDRQLLDSAILRVVQAPQNARMEETAAILASHHILDGWGMAYIPLHFLLIQDTGPAAKEGLERMFQWEQELAGKLAQNLFAEVSLFCPDKQYQSLFMLCWGISQKAWQEKLLAFSDKLASASSTIVQASPRVLGTDFFAAKGSWTNAAASCFCCGNTTTSPARAGCCLAACSPPLTSRWASPALPGGSPPSYRPKTPPGSPRCSPGPSAASKTPRTKKARPSGSAAR